MDEVLALFDLPAGGIAGGAAQGIVRVYLKKRFLALRDILIEEFRKAKIDKLNVASEDDLAGVLFRYFSAARENTARLNIRLMAKVMIGQAQRDRLFVDDFFRYADLIGMLTRDEILAVISLHIAKKENPDENCNRLWEVVTANVIPKFFKTDLHLRSALTGAMRSGLVITPPTLDDTGFFTTSPVMDEIEDLADFADAMRMEGCS